MTYVLLAAAMLVLFWPSQKKAAKQELPFVPKPPAAPTKPVIPSLQETLHCVHIVRRRLAMTEGLSTAAKESLDQIVLSVLAGTDPNERA